MSGKVNPVGGSVTIPQVRKYTVISSYLSKIDSSSEEAVSAKVN